MSQKAVTGSLSSRVMNMKFMRFSNNDTKSNENSNSNKFDRLNSRNTSRESSANPDNTESDNNANKFQDNSEWALPAHKNESNSTINLKDYNGESILVKKKRKIIRLNQPRRMIMQNVSVTTLNKDKMNLPVGKIKFDNDNGKKRTRDDEEATNEDAKGTADAAEGNDDYDLDKIFKETRSQSNSSNKNKKKKKNNKKRKSK